MIVRDDLLRPVTLIGIPQRIVSLCPSQTETLLALGAPVVGCTRYCIHPAPTVAGITKVGGTKQLDFEVIAGLQPDLVIAEKEENRREDVERLAAQWPVYVTDVRDYVSALRMVTTLGALSGRSTEAAIMASDIEQRWNRLPSVETSRRVLYLIWRKPWMAAGADTYIHAVLTRLGLENVAATLRGRYPILTAADFSRLAPSRVLLSSEPYPFGERHEAEMATLTTAAVERVDGEMFSWYGVRMQDAAVYLSARAQRWGGGDAN